MCILRYDKIAVSFISLFSIEKPTLLDVLKLRIFEVVLTQKVFSVKIDAAV